MKPLYIISSIILFLATNYFVCVQKEKNLIDEIFYLKKNTEEDDDNYYDNLNIAKDNYHNEKFRIFLTRSIIFGILSVISFIFLSYKYEKKYNCLINQPQPEMLYHQPNEIRKIYFNSPPF